MIQVTDEQIAERDRWERKLMAGEIDLFGGLYMMLSSGAPATPYLLNRLCQAEIAYQDGEADDFAEIFGVALSKREEQNMKHATLRNHVKWVVEMFKDEGYPILNPGQHVGVESAFTKAWEYIDKKTQDGEDTQPVLSVATIFDIYYDRDAYGKREALSEKNWKALNSPE